MAYGYGGSKDDVSSTVRSREHARGTHARPPTAPTPSTINHSHASASHLSPRAGPYQHHVHRPHGHHAASSSSDSSSYHDYAQPSRSFDRAPSYSFDGDVLPKHGSSSSRRRDDAHAHGGEGARHLEAVNVFGALRPRVVAPPEFEAPLAEIEAAVAVAAAKRAETGRYYGRGGAANRSRSSAFGSFGPLLVPSPPIQQHTYPHGPGTASGSSATSSSVDGRPLVAVVGWADRGKAALRSLTRKRAPRAPGEPVVGLVEA